MSEISAASESSIKTQILPVKLSSIEFASNAKLPTISDPTTLANIEVAARELSTTNNAVAFPTETVYGLGGCALDDESVKSIYKAKNRPADNPLIVHVSSIDQLQRRVLTPKQEIPAIYKKLIDRFWPGPLTILLPINEENKISKFVTAGQDTVAVRMPSHPVARALIAVSDLPLAAPSANASTRPSPTMAQHVMHDLHGRIGYILDGGACDVGVESTVVDGLVSPPMLLRPGGVSLEEIRQCDPENWGNVVVAKKTAGKLEPVKTPGMKYRHYSPSARVVLFRQCGDGVQAIEEYLKQHDDIKGDIALLRSKHFVDPSTGAKVGASSTGRIQVVKQLGTTGADISKNLFRLLREVDEMGVELIMVEGIEETEEGLAVMNRLSKAAYETIGGPR